MRTKSMGNVQRIPKILTTYIRARKGGVLQALWRLGLALLQRWKGHFEKRLSCWRLLTNPHS